MVQTTDLNTRQQYWPVLTLEEQANMAERYNPKPNLLVKKPGNDF